jgi:hypothetical protein
MYSWDLENGEVVRGEVSFSWKLLSLGVVLMLVLADGSCCSARDDKPRKTGVVASVEPPNQSRLASAGQGGGGGGGKGGGGGGGGGEGKIRMREDLVGHLAGNLCEYSLVAIRLYGVLRYVVCGER